MTNGKVIWLLRCGYGEKFLAKASEGNVGNNFPETELKEEAIQFQSLDAAVRHCQIVARVHESNGRNWYPTPYRYAVQPTFTLLWVSKLIVE